MSRQLLARVSALLALAPPLIVAAALPASAAKTVTVNCAHHSLQHAINHAHAGNTVLVKGHCIGTFTIGKNLTLEGNPKATLDARHKGPVVTIDGRRRVTLESLTVTNGTAKTGGGINLPDGGSLILRHVVVNHDTATRGSGGGIFAAHQATLGIHHSTINNDMAQPPTTSAEVDAFGGGIMATGPTTIIDSTISHDLVQGRGTEDSNGNGGAIYATGALTIEGSTLSKDRARSTAMSANTAQGGAVAWMPMKDDTLDIQHSTFGSDSAAVHDGSYTSVLGGALDLDPSVGAHALAEIGASTFSQSSLSASSSIKPTGLSGGAIAAIAEMASLRVKVAGTTITGSTLTGSGTSVVGAVGGGIYLLGATMSMSDSSVTDSLLQATSTSQDVDNRGGGIDAEDEPAELSISTSTISQNRVFGSAPAGKVTLSGGGLVETGSGPVMINRSTISGNGVSIQGAGEGLSTAYGGGLDFGSGGTDQVVNSTIVGGEVEAEGFGGTATLTYGGGGIAAFDTSLHVKFSTIVANDATIGGSPGGGGGIYVDPGSSVTLDGSILAANSDEDDGQCFGTITSGGHNVYAVSPDCTWTASTGDIVVTDPKLDHFGANGGPTSTFSLAPGSPAIDIAPVASCDGLTVDQRGVKRPQGSNCDAGAYELN